MNHGAPAPAEIPGANEFERVRQLCVDILSGDYSTPDNPHLVAESSRRWSLDVSETTDQTITVYQYYDPDTRHDMYFICESFTPKASTSDRHKRSGEDHENYYFYTLDATLQTVRCDYVGVFVSGSGHKRKREVVTRDDGLSITPDQMLAGDWRSYFSTIHIQAGEESKRARQLDRSEKSLLYDLGLMLRKAKESGDVAPEIDGRPDSPRNIGFVALTRIWNYDY